MAFEKGKPRPPGSGRKKGTPNKEHTFLHRVEVTTIDEIKKKHPDPLVRLLDIGNDPSVPVGIQVQALKEVVKYLHAQKREVELVNKLTLEDLLMQSYQAKIKEPGNNKE